MPSAETPADQCQEPGRRVPGGRAEGRSQGSRGVAFSVAVRSTSQGSRALTCVHELALAFGACASQVTTSVLTSTEVSCMLVFCSQLLDFSCFFFFFSPFSFHKRCQLPACPLPPPTPLQLQQDRLCQP